MTLVDSFRSAPSPVPFAPTPLPGFPCIPMPEVDANATSQQRWDRSLSRRGDEPDMLSIQQIAAMSSLPMDRIRTLVETGRAIALLDSTGELRLPYWQFLDPLWSQLPEIKSALRHRSPSDLLSFLEESSDCLHGLTPRMAVERGHLSRVLSYAVWSNQ